MARKNTSVPGNHANLSQMDNTNSPLPKIDINNTIGTDATTLNADAIDITGLLASYLSLTNIKNILKDLIVDVINTEANQ